MTVIEKVKKGLGEKIVNWDEYSPRRIYITIGPDDLKEAAKLLFEDYGFRFSIATGTDTLNHIELTYHFSCDKSGEFFSLRVHLEDKDNAEVDSLADMTKGAEWIEREIWELLGVKFTGHPGLKRLLLSEDWPEGKYPLRNEPEQKQQTGEV